jgi:TonB family protein
MVCLAFWLVSSLAQGQEPPTGPEEQRNTPPKSSEGFVPPELVDRPLEYPEGEHAAATVVLELTIGVNGEVSQARVLQGEPPFSDNALRAAEKWKFLPARQGERAVAARIRYRVEFEPPAEEPPSAPNAATPNATAPTTPKKPPPEPIEVVVRGQRAEPGVVKVTRAEARALPGTFGDPLRAIEAQPGVIPIASGLPSFFVRGAPPGNIGYFIDGVDVPLLYHAFFGPSVIHPGLIDSVELHLGVPPVEYGRFAGPVIASTVRPLERRFNGEASIRSIDAGALIEAPFGGCAGPETPGCSRGSARLGGRYSYTGLVLSALGDAKLNYWDYQGQADWALGPHDSMSILAFGAYDYFRSGGGRVDQGGGEVEFHRVDLRWDHVTGTSRLRVAVTGGYDSTGGVEEITSLVRDKSLRARAELEKELGEDVRLRTGIDGRVDEYDLETDPLLLNFQDYSALFPTRTDTVVGAYVATDIQAARGIVVVPGVRTDVYNELGETKVGVDPRVNMDFELTRRLSIDQSIGMTHQKPNFIPNVPAASVADLSNGLVTGVMWSSRIRYRLPDDVTASASVFRNAFFNVLDPLGGSRNFSIDRSVVGCDDCRATISAMGLELLLTRPLTRKLGGFLAYTLSRTIQTHGNVTSISGFDRPHVLQAALGYDFGYGITAGTRGLFYSGVPEANYEGTPHFVEDRRGPPYFRLDVRGEKRWRLGERAWLGVVAEVLNATSTSEVVRLDCGTRCVERRAGPVILPSIGVEGGF